MDDAFLLGWEEWAAFPKLGLPALKVKVDTGARTSALHAVSVEPFGPLDKPQVRFILHPVPEKPEIEVVCSAPAVDRREVTSSNGERELRWVIETPVKLTRDQKDLLKQFEETFGQGDRQHNPRSQTWLDGVRDFFDRMTS